MLARCANCEVDKARARLTPFERLAWEWYHRTVNPFVMESGMLPRLMVELEFPDDCTMVLFTRAMSDIYEAGRAKLRESARMPWAEIQKMIGGLRG